MCKIRAIMFAVMASVAVKGNAQDFFNLTANEVRIDSVLPVFTYTKQLGANFADSVYEVRIAYPEYIPMSKADIERCKRISNKPLPKLPEVHSYVSVDRKQGVLDVAFVPLVKQGGKYKKLVSFKLDITAKSAQAQAAEEWGSAAKAGTRSAKAAARTLQRYASHSVMSTGKWAKIRVPATGVYNLTNEVIRRAGFSNPDKVRIYGYGGNLQPEVLTADYLAATDDLQEVPTCVEGGKRLFWAKGPVYFNGEPLSTTGTGNGNRVRNTYSDYGYYLVTEGEDEPAHISGEELLATVKADSYYNNALYEVDNYAWFHGGRHLFNSQAITSGNRTTYSMDMPKTADNQGKETRMKIKVVLTADAASSAEVLLNGEHLCDMTIYTPAKYSSASVATSVTAVNSSAEKLDFTIVNKAGGNIRLDYIWVYRDDAMPLPDIAAGTFPTPEFVYGTTAQDLHSHTTADMIIIIPASQNTRAQAERLKALHEQRDGMTVRIVPADEIYNEFSSGTPDATAYKRYMKMLYDRAATAEEAPKYLLLMGDCAWDNRMNSGEWRNYSPDNFLLSYESENSVSSTDNYVSDDFFCLLDDGEAIEIINPTSNGYRFLGKMDVAVGRIPARNADDAKIAVDKIVAYANNENPGTWQNTIVVMGDDGDGNSHMQQAENIARHIESAHPSYDLRRIMWDAYRMEASSTGNSYPEVTDLVKNYIADGALIMNYTGHGAPYSMSHEKAILASYLINAKNKHLPLWVAASCDIMPYDGQEDNFGEGALFNKDGGAVAFFGAARTVYASQNQHINYNFMQEVLSTAGGKVAMGEAVRRSKNRLVERPSESESYQDATLNKLQYALLGDPALCLASPTATAVVDSIAGKSVEEGLQKLRAGEVVTIAGHIENNGALSETFNGSVTPVVQDIVQHVVCNLNPSAVGDTKLDTPFEFDMRQNNIFKGTDNVRNGRFSFSFAVPKDISYSDETGKIILYAVSDDNAVTAAGWNEMIAFNGYDEAKTDSLGPSVFCYLNEERFANGDVVNATPYFVAQLYDEDGINASGSGIGHNMQLIIDGDMNRTYNLNDYFTYDFGSYQSGTVGFSIPALEAGRHKLTFRAWDVLNNSTTAQLDFRVEHGIQPKLIDISCTRNPATTSTQFCIVSDRISTSIDFVVDVFDMAGRHLWSHASTATPDRGGVFVDWDLSMSGGGRLSTGVYLYRVRVRAEGSSYVSKAKKLIIIQ